MGWARGSVLEVGVNGRVGCLLEHTFGSCVLNRRPVSRTHVAHLESTPFRFRFYTRGLRKGCVCVGVMYKREDRRALLTTTKLKQAAHMFMNRW